MKNITVLFLLFFGAMANAAPDLEIYYRQNADGFDIYANNKSYCPISITINFDLTNLKEGNGIGPIYVVPAGEDYMLITQLVKINKIKEVRFKYTYSATYGVSNKHVYDAAYKYNLPFKKGDSARIGQGYNGDISHQGQNAIDFTMPVGTEVHAARDGIVVDLVDQNYKSCASESCKQFNNFILIYQSDGTFAEYSHLKQYGSVVKVGQRVNIGQLIGYSGDTGWSTGPHLHFQVFFQDVDKRRALKTNFLIGDGSDYSILTEEQEYVREY